MIIHAFLGFLSIVFFELFVLLKLKKDAAEIVSDSLESMRILSSSQMGDHEKEALARRVSAKMVKATGRFGFKLLLIGSSLYLLSIAFTKLVPGGDKELLDRLSSFSTIALLTIVVLVYSQVRRVARRRR